MERIELDQAIKDIINDAMIGLSRPPDRETLLSFEDAIRAYLSALPPAVPEWRTMDSAPKDGTPILIWQPHGHHFGERDQYQAERDGPVVYYDDNRWAIGYWRPWGGWGNRNAANVNPTHWQPLPASPAAPGSGG